MIEVHNGELAWVPKLVIYEGREYPAPLNLLPILVRGVLLNLLLERNDTIHKRAIR